MAHVGQELGLGLIGQFGLPQSLQRFRRLAPQIVQHGVECEAEAPYLPGDSATELWHRHFVVAFDYGFGSGCDKPNRARQGAQVAQHFFGDRLHFGFRQSAHPTIDAAVRQ